MGQRDVSTLSDDDLLTSLKMLIKSESWPLFKALFDENVSLENPKPRYMRSTFLTAGPL